MSQEIEPIVFPMVEGQMIEGWVTVTWIEEEGHNAIYGIFEDEFSAQEWAKNLRQEWTSVRPIFTPTHNKG